MSDVLAMGILRGKVGVALVFSAVFVLVLVVLIGREIFAKPTPIKGASAAVRRVESPALASPGAPAAPSTAPRPATGAVAAARAVVAPPSPPHLADGPAAAQALATIVDNPRATAPTNVVQNARNHSETYAYEKLLPFTGADLTRDKKDPSAWQLNAAMGPPMEDLAPRGGIREAIVQKDDQGNPFATWYAIESGPLAPAYVMRRGDLTRVISRSWLETNRADFPPSLTAVLDR